MLCSLSIFGVREVVPVFPSQSISNVPGVVDAISSCFLVVISNWLLVFFFQSTSKVAKAVDSAPSVFTGFNAVLLFPSEFSSNFRNLVEVVRVVVEGSV